MKKYLDKLKNKLYFNKNLFVFLFILVLVGITSGALFTLILNDSDKKIVADYLNKFLSNILKHNFNYKISFFNVAIINLGFALLIWIFGISVIGILFVLPFLFIKSFMLGFSIGSILLNFKFKGILISLIYVVPHYILNMLIYILISAYSIMISYRLFNCMKNKLSFNFKLYMNRYLFILFFSLGCLIFSSLYEVFILPRLMRIVINLLK